MFRPLHSTSTTLSGLVATALLVLPFVSLPAGCQREGATTPAMTEPFRDNFDRAELGSDWNPTGDQWSIRDGELPRNARIEFDAWSTTPEGDIKCEVYGDGRSYARDVSYTATSYVVIFGGWRNSLNVIARMDEHAADRRVRQGPRVVPNQRYHWVIERRGNVLSWSIDGQPMLEFNDPQPLAGPGHEYFAFNNWSVELGFDNLVITPL
jgi:hypothetical protein